MRRTHCVQIFAFALLAAQGQPAFNQAEIEAKSALAPLHGTLQWVVPDPRESAEEWVLSLDIENKNQTFDCSIIATLKRLYALRILGGKVKANSLTALHKLPQLGLLVITGEGISDAGLHVVAKCRRINKLDVAGKNFSPESLAAVAKMTSLRRLFLYNTNVQDRDLKPLESMSFLEQLTLPQTVTTAGMGALAKKLPRTHVSRF